MKHILKEYRRDGNIWVDKILNVSEASAGDIVEIHTIDGSVIYKVLITGICKECSQYDLEEHISNGCFSTTIKGTEACPTADTDLVFKDLDNILEGL